MLNKYYGREVNKATAYITRIMLMSFFWAYIMNFLKKQVMRQKKELVVTKTPELNWHVSNDSPL